MAVEELLLVWNPLDPPLGQQAGRALRIDELAPGQGQLRHEPVRVARLQVVPQRLQDVPAGGLGLVGGLAEVPVQLVEAEEVGLVGPVHVRGVREVEVGPVLVPQGEEVGGGGQGVVDRMEGLAGDLGGTGDGGGGPVAVLPPGGDGPHLVGVQRGRRALDPLPQSAGDGLLDVQEGHHVDQVVDLQAVQMVAEVDERGHVGGQPVVAAPLAAAVPPLGQADDGVGTTERGQDEVGQGGRHVGLEVVGVVGDERAGSRASSARGRPRRSRRRPWPCPRTAGPDRTSRPAPRPGAGRRGRSRRPPRCRRGRGCGRC